MKQLILLTLTAIVANAARAQITLQQLPSGNNKIATVSEQVGLTNVTIHYNRPAVKGREGKVWGQLVHNGFVDQQFGSSKSAPWRAGANENTTIEFSNDVIIEGQPLKKGRYGFFIAYDSLESTVIFSSGISSWGSYFYDDKEDALRVKVKPVALTQAVERLKFEFSDQTDTTAVVGLLWEKKMIPFKVSTNYTNDQLALFRSGLLSERGFYWQSWDEAARWCLNHNTNLEQALLWSDTASGPNFGGNAIFSTKTTKAQILAKLGREKEAEDVMNAALPIANMQELHNYGRQLLTAKKPKEALTVFQLNIKKNPTEFTPKVGLARGYSANGDYKNALKYAQLALPQAPNDINKKGLETMIEKLKKGQDVN